MPRRWRIVGTACVAMLVIAGTACRRASLQPDAGGAGIISLDGAPDSIVSEVHPTPSGLDAAPSADAICGVTEFSQIVYPSDILVLLDQSVASGPREWSDMLTALTDVIEVNGSAISWGLYTFPEPGPACGPDTAAPVIDVPVTYGDYLPTAAGVASSRRDGKGSPTAAAIDFGRAYLPTLPTAPARVLLLMTDHAPSCAGMIGALSADAVQAQADARAAVLAAAAANIPTIVFAPSTTAASDVPALNALAAAGGEYARTGNPLLFQDETSLRTLFKPRPKNCKIPLSPPPPAPDLVTVTFNDQPVPRDKTHMSGWDYTDQPDAATDASYATIEFFGDWCVTLLDAQSRRFRVYYGCLSTQNDQN